MVRKQHLLSIIFLIIFTIKQEQPTSGGGNTGGTPPPSTPTNQPPVAKISLENPYAGFVGEEIIFNASNSSDQDGTIQEWFWDFGDNNNGSGKTITHTYDQPGTYIVTLYVIDD